MRESCVRVARKPLRVLASSKNYLRRINHSVKQPYISILTAFLLAWGAAARTDAAPKVGDVVFSATFDDADALATWEGSGNPAIRLEPRDGGTFCVRVDRPMSAGAGSTGVRMRLPVENLRGARVRVEALVKAENVARPPQPWNGVECMLHTVAPAGQRWSQQNDVFGTFDWKPVGFTTEVPADATEAWLVLGLEATTGRAWFDNVKITVLGLRRSVPAEKPQGPIYKGHNRPRLRGAMIGTRVDEEDLRVLAGQWGANHIRWQLLWGGFPHSPADTASVEEYRRWLDTELARLDRLLPVCQELGVLVLIDLHTPPGGRNEAKECRMFHDPQFQQAFLDVWRTIARRYQGNDVIWGYDLVNEPVEGIVPEGWLDWRTLAEKTARMIRELGDNHAIIVEPAPWGGPEALEWFQPLDVPGIVYSVHMYQPHAFTHQGVHNDRVGISYPGEIDGQYWDRDALRRALQPAIDYQRDYGVHIYIGEFSAIRWAPGDSAYNYLRDCISLFEEQGWDWAYHAFREWEGWSVEHGSDRNDRSRSPRPTSREQLLRSWFAKNRKTDNPM